MCADTQQTPSPAAVPTIEPGATIAVDHDSTLAATSETAFDLMCGPDHAHCYDDIESWDWGLEEFGTERFLSALWHAWTLRPHEVPLMDDTVVDTMHQLNELYEVHIVTAHPDHMGIGEGKQQWLASHDIPYDEFHVVPTDQTKAALSYDAYIDDKPSLPAKVNAANNAPVFLRDHTYNRDADGDYIRIHELADVLEYLSP